MTNSHEKNIITANGASDAPRRYFLHRTRSGIDGRVLIKKNHAAVYFHALGSRCMCFGVQTTAQIRGGSSWRCTSPCIPTWIVVPCCCSSGIEPRERPSGASRASTRSNLYTGPGSDLRRGRTGRAGNTAVRAADAELRAARLRADGVIASTRSSPGRRGSHTAGLKQRHQKNISGVWSTSPWAAR